MSSKHIPTLTQFASGEQGLSDEEREVLDFAGGAIIQVMRAARAANKHSAYAWFNVETLRRQIQKGAGHAIKSLQQIDGEMPLPGMPGRDGQALDHHGRHALARLALAVAWEGLYEANRTNRGTVLDDGAGLQDLVSTVLPLPRGRQVDAGKGPADA